MNKSVAISKNGFKKLGERKSKIISRDDNMMDLQIVND